MRRNVKVLITGGHLTPALATIEILKKKQVEIVFAGRKTTDVHLSSSQEQRLIESMGLPFESIEAAKFHRKPVGRNWAEISKLGKSLAQSWQMIRRHQPDVVLSFGGYLAVPVVVAAKLMHIPVVTHEQTMALGLANQIIAGMADQVAISWPDTQQAPHRCVLVGNPVRSGLLVVTKTPQIFKTLPDKPIIYVTGGNQGAQAINQAVIALLPELVEKYVVIHQTGATRNQVDLNAAKQRRHGLADAVRNNYLPQAWFSAEEVGWLLKQCSLVISRAGANTVTELLVTGTRAILIPLPVSGRNEQQMNAQLFEKLGLGVCLDQDKLHLLAETIASQAAEPSGGQTPQLHQLRQLHLHAADKLVKLTLSCATESPK